jgi:hypothetical protein
MQRFLACSHKGVTMRFSRTSVLTGALSTLLLGGVLLAPTLSRGAGTVPATAPAPATASAPTAPTQSGDVGIKIATGDEATIHEFVATDGTPCVALVGHAGVALVCNGGLGMASQAPSER